MIETVIRDRRSDLIGEKNMSHFPFRGSPNTQNNVASTPPSPTTAPSSGPPAMGVSTTIPPGARSSSPCSATSGPPNSRCCDTGRPIFTDPISGQTICSCQYDLISYQRLASAGIAAAGPGGMPLSMYSAPYPEGMAAYFPALGADQAPFYPNPAAAGLDLKDGGAPWPYPSVYHPYDAAFAGYPFNGYGMDLNGARRKNATRETTSTLKAWLNEHKKNPYPTKGEKIMLAIITKMTLTQVSTWFANARRRLKKENKMTWEPRNRVEDDDVNLDDDDDHKSTDEKDMLDSKDSGTGSSEDGDRPSRLDVSGHNDWNGSRNGSGPNSPDIYDRPGMHGVPHHHHPLLHSGHHPMHHLRPPTGSPLDTNNTSGANTNPNVINKPRIWSLADMASKESKDSPDSHSPPTSMYSHPGKIISPLAGRGLHPLHHPYMRPELYRNFYGSAAAHLSGGPPDMALLEQYQRTFGAQLVHNGLPGTINPLTSIMSKSVNNGPPFGPLSLTTSQPLPITKPPPGVSPASSTSSNPVESTPNNNIQPKSVSQPPSVAADKHPINVTKP